MAITKASASGLAGSKFKDASAGTEKIADVPDAPTISGSPVRIDLGAQVPFTAPNRGGTPTSYTITASPGGATANGNTSPITITGLNSGTEYTFSIRANNGTGSSANSAASNSITAAAAIWALGLTANNTQQYTIPSGVSELGIYAFGGGATASNNGVGGAGGSAHSGLIANPSPNLSELITVGAGGGGVSSFGSFLDSSGGGNATSKTAGNGGGGQGQAGGNVTQSSVGQTYNYGGGGGNGGAGNGSNPNDFWPGHGTVHRGGSAGNAGGSPNGGAGGGGGGGTTNFTYPNWHYGAGQGGAGSPGLVPSGGGGGGGGGGHNGNSGTGQRGAAGVGGAGRVIVWEKKVS